MTALATVRSVKLKSTSLSGRALATLAAVAAVLAAAFVFAPPMLAATRSSGDISDEHHLIGAFHEAFVEYWRSGDRTFSPRLAGVVDYWFRYHVAKAAIAALLLIVLVVLGVLLWKAFLRTVGARRRTALASSGALVTMLALFSLTTVMANVQGAVAPFASLLPMLTEDATEAQLAGTLEQVRQRLTDDDHTSPALQMMISDFARYHVAMVVIAAIVAVGFVALSVVLWKRFASTGASGRGSRRLPGSFGVLSVLWSLVVIVVALANTTTAADPTPALAAFFNGGW